MEDRSVLVIAFKFPPYAGVGAKRWAKFSKYLAKDGFTVHVVTVKWWRHGPNTWTEDINHPGIVTHRIPSLGLHNLRYLDPGHIPLRKLFLMAQFAMFRFLSLLYYVDEAQFWGVRLLPFCERLIRRKKIRNVIATGLPFMANYWAARLKERMPEINLIQDFRDPWMDERESMYGISPLHRRALGKKMFTLNHCDHVISVSELLTKMFASKRTSDRNSVIYNGYDEEQCKRVEGIEYKEFGIIYAGNISSERKVTLDAFLRYMENNHSRYEGLRISLYGSFTRHLNIERDYPQLFRNGMILVHDAISPDRVVEKIRESFLTLQVTAPFRQEALSSKLFEYAALGRPVICVHNGGEIERVVDEYHLGSSIRYRDHSRYRSVMDHWYEIWKANKYFSLPEVAISKFSYRNLVKEIEGLFVF